MLPPGMLPGGIVDVPGGMAAAPSVSGSIHPSRMPQLGNLPGAVGGSYQQPGGGFPGMQQQMPPQGLGMIPPHLQALMGGGGSGGMPAPGNLPGTRQARRLYVGGCPLPITENEIRQFWNEAMKTAFPDLPPGDSVVSIYLNVEKKFAFVELRNPEEATAGMGLDGIIMRGQQLRVKRPSDYDPRVHGSAPSASRIVPSASAAAGPQISSQVPDGPNKVFAGGIPYAMSEDDIKELVGSFGQLRAFHLVKERDSNMSKGSVQSQEATARPLSVESACSSSFSPFVVQLLLLRVRRSEQHRHGRDGPEQSPHR
jgi:hypothetical protein